MAVDFCNFILPILREGVTEKLFWTAVVFDHALCWIHAERGILKLNPISDDRKAAVESARKQIWGLYGKR